MRENRTSGSMRGRRKRATLRRACALLYGAPNQRRRAAASLQGSSVLFELRRRSIAESGVQPFLVIDKL
jgi:hypothetical protein